MVGLSRIFYCYFFTRVKVQSQSEFKVSTPKMTRTGSSNYACSKVVVEICSPLKRLLVVFSIEEVHFWYLNLAVKLTQLPVAPHSAASVYGDTAECPGMTCIISIPCVSCLNPSDIVQ